MSSLSQLLAIFRQAPGYYRMFAVVMLIVGAGAIIRRIFRKELERDQYYYLQDICLIASWALCGIWSQDPTIKLTITAGVIAGLVGFCQKVIKNWDLRFCFLAIGLGVAILGPRITFIGQPQGEFLYLTNDLTIMVLIALWISFFPILFQEIDEVPGMGGGFLLVSWLMTSAMLAFSSKGFSDALIVAVCGAALIVVFWGRHVNVYRRLGTPLSAMWGALLACTSMIGASRGIAFAAVMALPLGLFIIPIIETSLSVFSAAFSPKPVSNMMLYRVFVSRGFEHPTAVFLVILMISVCGVSFSLLQMGMIDPLSLVLSLVLFFLGCKIAYARTKIPPEGSISRPALWGVAVDNFSLDYALGRVSGWLSTDTLPQMIVTPDALAALRSRRDKRYANIVSRAGLVLPDGTGLLWALRFLGCAVKERIPGVEFVDHLCRIASSRGWPVYFFGGRPGIAQRAADKMSAAYRGLIVAGARDGYFSRTESSDIAHGIARSGAKIVFVALGVPKQEYWIDEHLQQMESVVAIGVGGSFDVISGELKRAPVRWRKMKLEWLYRTIQEPKRWRRVIKLPLFVLLVLMKKLHLDPWHE